MKKRSRFIVLCIIIVAFFIIDRYVWMPDRAKQLWRWESGIGLGDPIAYNQDFEIEGTSIIFKENKNKESFPIVYYNRKSAFYLVGCYFGRLYIYDTVKKRITVYVDN